MAIIPKTCFPIHPLLILTLVSSLVLSCRDFAFEQDPDCYNQQDQKHVNNDGDRNERKGKYVRIVLIIFIFYSIKLQINITPNTKGMIFFSKYLLFYQCQRRLYRA
jgi:hypothetical protein